MNIIKVWFYLSITVVLTNLAWADSEIDSLRTEIQRLTQRLEQIEAQRATEITHRVENQENAAAEPKKISRLEETLEGVSVDASLIMVAQKVQGLSMSGTSQLNTRADVAIKLPGGSIGSATGKIFTHFRAGDGNGINTNAFMTSNATVFNNAAQPVLVQAWYQLDIPLTGEFGRIEMTVGKIDLGNFFDGNKIADDESEGYLNVAFVHNPLLDVGDFGNGEHDTTPGIRLGYISDINKSNHVTISAGIFGAGNGASYNNSFHKPYAIAQLEYAGNIFSGMDGTYRIYTWNNAQADDRTNINNNDGHVTQESHRGWGISLDQEILDHVTLFARYGHSIHGHMNFDRAFTLGGQVAGAHWGRENDRVGLAYGELKTSNVYKNAGIGSGNEKIHELFYALQVNEHLQIMPSIQHIINPSGTHGDDLTVYAMRAKAVF
ncbi:Carbohydrate porin [Gammaproteobacteria bacterium]